MSGHNLFIAVIFLVTVARYLPVNGSSICVEDSASVDGGGEGDGEYASVLLVGRYKMKMDSMNEQVSILPPYILPNSL